MSNTTNLLPIAFKAVVKCKFNKLLICMAMLCASITATAYDFEVDGIYYNKLTNKTCEVTYETTSYKTYSGDIAIPQKVSFDGATYTVTSIGSSAFRYCSNLISIAFPSSLTSIGDLAFNSCTSLATVIIPNSVTAIRKYAFKGCTSLATVIIPNSITSIEDYVFEDCTSLVSVTIPSSVTSIGTAVFMGCISIKNINIPNSVTSIGSAAFYKCSDCA
jgi:hypothetical protein